jgi:hypothetical protein
MRNPVDSIYEFPLLSSRSFTVTSKNQSLISSSHNKMSNLSNDATDEVPPSIMTVFEQNFKFYFLLALHVPSLLCTCFM